MPLQPVAEDPSREMSRALLRRCDLQEVILRPVGSPSSSQRSLGLDAVHGAGVRRRCSQSGRLWRSGVLVAMVVLGACGSGDTQPERGTRGPEREEMSGASPIQLGSGGHAPAIAIDRDGVVHVAWVAGLTAEAQVLHRSLPPGGEWSNEDTVSTGFQYNGAPSLLVKPSGQVCVTWVAGAPETGLYIRCWGRGGWTPSEMAVPSRGLTATYAPAFAPDGTLHAAWEIPPSTIGADDTTLTPDEVTAGSPALAIDAAGGFHVAWLQFANQTDAVDGMAYANSPDGTSWEPSSLLNPKVSTTHELIADEQGSVHWLAVDGTYRRWTPSNGWSEAVATGTAGLGNARLAVAPNGLARVAFAAPDGVYLTRQQDSEGWGPPELLEGSDGVATEAVAIAVDPDGGLHVVWETSGDESEIRYATVAP